jgi:LPXTG-site transpeptidase (sortase) family protein
VPATLGEVATDDVHPVRLRVASIGIEVEVVAVGVDGEGDMEVPSPEVAGWYQFGPAPGGEGTSVLAAHVDYDGRPGAFFRLRELEIGDQVEVSMSDGSVVALSVSELSKVDKDDLAAAGVFDRRGSPRIALITCGGAFDRSLRSYEDNVVAIAGPVG